MPENVLINTIIITDLILAVTSIIVGILVFIRDVQRSSNLFFLFTAVVIGAWSVSLVTCYTGYNMISFHNLSIILLYLFESIIPLALVLFALTFAQNKIAISHPKIFLMLLPCLLVVGTLFFIPSYIVSPVSNGNGVETGPFYGVFVLYVAVYMLVSCYLLLKKYKASAGVFKTIVRSVAFAVLGGAGGILITNIILPYFKINDAIILGPLIGFAMLLFIGFKIFKYHLWDLKSFFTQLFVTLVSLALVAQIVIAETAIDLTINIIVLALFLMASYFLLKNIDLETHAKEKIEVLVKDLADVNEKLQLLDKRKSEFVKISAHHLKNPLTAIKGYASMLLEGSFGRDINSDALGAIRKIFNSSDRLVEIIKDFMDISNIESGKMEYDLKDMDLKKLVEGIVDEMSFVIKTSGLDISFNTDEIEGYVIVADCGKIHQVISNLIDNSVKYTPKGHIHLFLKKDKENRRICLTITDTGIGMSDDTMNKLFEKFSRAEGINKLYTGGSGLGLYVAKEIMKKHEARIWAESPGEGKGSTFHLEFAMK